MSNWISITIDELREAKVAKLVDACSARAKADGQPDRAPGLIQGVVDHVRRKISSNPANRLDADPTRIPKGLRDLAVDLIIARLKTAVERTLNEDERMAVSRHERDLDRIADGRDTVEQPDEPGAGTSGGGHNPALDLGAASAIWKGGAGRDMSLGLVIAPLEEAVKRMDRKSPVAQALSHEEWAEVPLALRERAFWSANFARADMLQVMHDMIGERLSLERRESVPGRGEVLVSRDNFVVEMRERLRTSGYLPPAGKEGSLQDMTSTGRLGLIYDFNTQQAQEFARWKAGQDEGALDAFPAQELFRAEDRMVPRNWLARWAEAGGQLHDGRMIARKDDPIWMAISAFGTPFPPFDFNSGMDIRDIGRREAEELGVLSPGDTVEPPEVGFNDALEKSVEGYAPEIRAAVLGELGDRAAVEDGIAKWIGGGDNDARAAVGKSGNWQSLGLRPAAEIPADNAEPTLTTAEARALLASDYEIPTPLGDKARFGPHILEHWEEKKKTPADIANRLHHLPAAEAAVRNPHEVWENEHTGTRTFVHVTRDEHRARVMHAWELTDGELDSYVSTTDIERRGNQFRKGKLIYAR